MKHYKSLIELHKDNGFRHRSIRNSVFTSVTTPAALATGNLQATFI